MNYLFLNISYPSYTYEPRHYLGGGGIRSACVAIGMFSDNSDRCFRQLHYWIKLNLVYDALHSNCHYILINIYTCTNPHLQTLETGARKLIFSLLRLFSRFVVYKSKSIGDWFQNRRLIFCTKIGLFFKLHFKLTISNRGHLLEYFFQELNSMRWVGQPLLAI